MPDFITLPELVALVVSAIGAIVAIRKERSDFGSAAADLAEGAHRILSPLTERIGVLEKENTELKASGEKGKKVLAKKVKRHIKILKICIKMISDAIEHIQTLMNTDEDTDPLSTFPKDSG